MAEIVDSYSGGGTDVELFLGNVTKVFQSFTGDGGTLNSVTIRLKKIGSPTGNTTFNIYAHSGTYGTSSVGTGSALATSETLDVSTLTTSYQDITLDFSGAEKIELTNGTYYIVTCDYAGGNSSNKIAAEFDASSPTHDGNGGAYPGVWFPNNGTDMYFIVYKDSAVTSNGNFFQLL